MMERKFDKLDNKVKKTIEDIKLKYHNLKTNVRKQPPRPNANNINKINNNNNE